MALTINVVRTVPVRAKAVAHLLTSDRVASEDGAYDWGTLAFSGFEGKAGTTAVVTVDAVPTLLVGMGAADAIGTAEFRKAGVAIARKSKKFANIAVVLDGLDPDVDQLAGLSEGVALGHYEFNQLKSDATASKLTKVSVVAAGKGLTAAIKRGQIVADAVNWSRDLVNRPGGELTPAELAKEAADMAKAGGITAQVMSPAAIKKARLGGLLGVNRGSEQEARLVRLTYTPKGKAKAHLALVGKGITFDSGGLSIKSGTGMMTMKMDMGGAAAVLGAMRAIAALAPKVKVTCICPMTDNMTGPDATRPGDVLVTRSGKTIEVLNTDAEGRLVLADGLTLACEAKPDAIVDAATLTGACMVALGNRYAGLMGNDDQLIGQIKEAADTAGELLWHLPLPDEYNTQLDSKVADIKNIGGPYAGALTAGLFLQNFVDSDIPWAHLDIAGPAFADSAGDDHPAGGTGYGVRTLLALVESMAS